MADKQVSLEQQCLIYQVRHLNDPPPRRHCDLRSPATWACKWAIRGQGYGATMCGRRDRVNDVPRAKSLYSLISGTKVFFQFGFSKVSRAILVRTWRSQLSGCGVDCESCEKIVESLIWPRSPFRGVDFCISQASGVNFQESEWTPRTARHHAERLRA